MPSLGRGRHLSRYYFKDSRNSRPTVISAKVPSSFGIWLSVILKAHLTLRWGFTSDKLIIRFTTQEKSISSLQEGQSFNRAASPLLLARATSPSMLPTVSPPPVLDRRPLVRQRFCIKREAEPPSTSLVRLGSHVISHPHARSGPVNTLGPYLVHLPRITIGLHPREKKTFSKPKQVAASVRRWTGDYHPAVLRELSDMVPIEMLTARQRTNTTAVVASATALIFAYQGKNLPVKFDTPVLKDLVKYLEKYVPKRFFDGKQGTRMEMFLRAVKRFLLHLAPKKLIHLDNEDDLEPLQDFNRIPLIKIEDTENMPPRRNSYMDDLENLSAPPLSRKRGLDDAGERPTKRARPGQGLSPRHDNFLSNQYHPSTETDGMKQLLELAGLGAADVDRCLRFMAHGMSAKRAIAELGKHLRLPA